MTGIVRQFNVRSRYVEKNNPSRYLRVYESTKVNITPFEVTLNDGLKKFLKDVVQVNISVLVVTYCDTDSIL